MYRDDRANCRPPTERCVRPKITCRYPGEGRRMEGSPNACTGRCGCGRARETERPKTLEDHCGRENTHEHREESLPCRPKEDCGCRRPCMNNASNLRWGIEDYPLASVYAAIQSFDELYDCETGMSRGTIFAKLDLPFHGSKDMKGGGCHG